MDIRPRVQRLESEIYGPTADSQPSPPRSLGSLAYDQTFGIAGKLRLANITGWASCIIPSTTKQGYLLATYYETLNRSTPERQYAAHVARFDTAGNLDTSFGDLGTGFIEANFTRDPGRISLLRGLHETTAGDIFNWGDVSWLDNGFIDFSYAITKRLSSGALDSSFGLDGKVDIHTLVDFEARLISGNACIVSTKGIFVGIVEDNEDGSTYHIL